MSWIENYESEIVELNTLLQLGELDVLVFLVSTFGFGTWNLFQNKSQNCNIPRQYDITGYYFVDIIL